jgi:hypothetical protein
MGDLMKNEQQQKQRGRGENNPVFDRIMAGQLWELNEE